MDPAASDELCSESGSHGRACEMSISSSERLSTEKCQGGLVLSGESANADDESIHLGLDEESSEGIVHEEVTGMVVSGSDGEGASDVAVESDGCIAISGDEYCNDEAHERRGGLWAVGRDCGPWLPRPESWPQIALVVLTNVFVNLTRLRIKFVKMLVKAMEPKDATRRDFAARAAALLTGVPKVSRLVQAVRNAGWEPQAPSDRQACPQPDQQEADREASPRSVQDPQRRALSIRVRESLHTAWAGLPDTEYRRSISRYRLAAIDMGSKYDAGWFARTVEFFGELAARGTLCDELGKVLPGLGIPSDFVLAWDGVSIGGGTGGFCRNETLCLIGLGHVDRGVIRYDLAGAPSLVTKHSRQDSVNLVIGALADAPLRLNRDSLLARLALIGGDGAVSASGVPHPSTGAAERLWESLHPGVPGFIFTEWDAFHKVDNAFDKAFARSKAATELCNVARALNALFGVGDGRLLLRATATSIGAPVRRFPDQGGTRAVVAKVRTIEYLRQNFKLIHAALRSRLGWRHGGHGAQSLTSLIHVCRRFTAVNFVTFTLAACDTLSSRVSRLALQVQELSSAAGTVRQQWQTCLWGLVADEVALQRVYVWCVVSALVGGSISRTDHRNLWQVLRLSPLGRAFPSLVSNLNNILWRRVYQGCGLQVDFSPGTLAGPERHTLSPSCQCASMKLRPRQGVNRVVEVSLAAARISVPEWVAYSTLPREAFPSLAQLKEECGILLAGPDDVPVAGPERGNTWCLGSHGALPRYAVVAVEARPPLQLQGIPRYRRHTCVTSADLSSTLAAIQEGIFAALRLCSHLRHLLEDHARPSDNDGTGRAAELSAVCWDWAYLVEGKPQRHHFSAFFDLVALLRPTLKHTVWPDARAFPHVPHRWPLVRGPGGLAQQYHWLTNRVRQAAGKFAYRHWWSVTLYYVRPVMRNRVLEASLGLLPIWRKDRLTRAAVFACMAECVQKRVPNAFPIRPTGLAALGCSSRLRGARSKRRLYEFHGREGSFAATATMPFLTGGKGKLVRVQRVLRELQVPALEATLDTDPSFTQGPDGVPAAGPQHAWHAVRVHHRARLLRCNEATVERWGSQLHMLWDSVSGMPAQRMVSRLFVRAAGFDGGRECEEVVGAITRYLAEDLAMAPITLRPSLRHARIEPSGASRVAAPALLPHFRESSAPAEAARCAACPMTLPTPAAEALSRGITSIGFASLPYFQEAGSTPSVMRDKHLDWLRSKKGVEWLAERKRVWSTAFVDEAVEEAEEGEEVRDEPNLTEG